MEILLLILCLGLASCSRLFSDVILPQKTGVSSSRTEIKTVNLDSDGVMMRTVEPDYTVELKYPLKRQSKIQIEHSPFSIHDLESGVFIYVLVPDLEDEKKIARYYLALIRSSKTESRPNSYYVSFRERNSAFTTSYTKESVNFTVYDQDKQISELKDSDRKEIRSTSQFFVSQLTDNGGFDLLWVPDKMIKGISSTKGLCSNCETNHFSVDNLDLFDFFFLNNLLNTGRNSPQPKTMHQANENAQTNSENEDKDADENIATDKKQNNDATEDANANKEDANSNSFYVWLDAKNRSMQ